MAVCTRDSDHLHLLWVVTCQLLCSCWKEEIGSDVVGAAAAPAAAQWDANEAWGAQDQRHAWAFLKWRKAPQVQARPTGYGHNPLESVHVSCIHQTFATARLSCTISFFN
jgi:hypothetical protein